MSTYEILLKGHREVAAGTLAFSFTKPPGFAFKPGQAITLLLADPPLEANSRQRIFSLVSAPFEAELAIATRMREGSAFKRALKNLQPGAKLQLRGPRGTMTLHEERSRSAVFIAGGIGITPFMSMLRQAAHDRLAQRLLLICSNRRREDTPFLAELRDLARQDGNFRMLSRMTDTDGFIDAETIRSFVGDAAAPIYYLAGPPAMVDAMKAVLRGAGVGDGDVQSEQFYGY
ncbi:MAG: FAD-dependent oxidoreductase [Betaproteobacteria bacterium]|nr:MAG: FAD-dependent oxidoreductase [Betaproteobacteria bacterium]